MPCQGIRGGIRSGQRVCVVDDDASVRNSVSRLLRTARYAVTTYSSATDFLASGAGDTSDCAILDIHLNGMDGLSLQEKLAETGSRIPVIIVTALEEEHLRERALKNGAAGFFRKPFPGNELLEAVKIAIGVTRMDPSNDR